MKKQLYSFLAGAFSVAIFVYVTESLSKKNSQLSDMQAVLEYMDNQAAAEYSKAAKGYQTLIDQGVLVDLSGYSSRVDFAVEVLGKQNNKNELSSACARDFAKFLDIAESALADGRFSSLEETIKKNQKMVMKIMDENSEISKLVSEYRSEPSH